MAVISHLIARRDNSYSAPGTSTMLNLLIALVVLCAVGCICVGILFIIRSRRRSQESASSKALDDEYGLRRSKPKPGHCRLATRTSILSLYSSESESIQEKQPQSSQSPVPEIRITLPEEDDNGNKRASGRVVIAKINDQGSVGLEPYNDNYLPPFQHSAERLESLDLERMGGLKEKEYIKI